MATVNPTRLPYPKQSIDLLNPNRKTAGENYELFRDSKTAISLQKALLPTIAHEEHITETQFLVPAEDVISSFTELLVFSIANNFVHLRKNSHEILRSLKEPRNRQLLRSFSGLNGPAVEALVEKSFQIAIEAGDIELVAILLRHGSLDLSSLVLMISGQRYTSVEYSTVVGNVEITKALIDAGADVNGAFGQGTGALGMVFCGRFMGTTSAGLRMISLLLESGADVHSQTLSLALIHGNQQLLQTLINSSNNTTRSKWISDDILVSAIRHSTDNSVTDIIKQIARPEVIATCSTTKDISKNLSRALDEAAKRGNFGLVKFLSTHATTTDITLSNSILSGNTEAFRFLLDRAVDTHAVCSGSSPFVQAIRSILKQVMIENKAVTSVVRRDQSLATLNAVLSMTNSSMICKKLETTTGSDLKELLELVNTASQFLESEFVEISNNKGSELDSYPVREALALGDRQMVEDLIMVGLNIDEVWPIGKSMEMSKPNYQSALTMSIMRNYDAITYFLLDYGADINSCTLKNLGGLTALASAAFQRNLEVFGELLARGADPNDSEALFYSVASRNAILLDRLLEAHASTYPCGIDGFGSRILAEAIDHKDEKLITRLLTVKIDLNNLDFTLPSTTAVPMMATPLGVAIMTDRGHNLELVRRLLNAGGDPNSAVLSVGVVPNNNSPKHSSKEHLKFSAILTAVETGSIGMAQLLIDAGANINQPTTLEIRRTPLQLAAHMGDFEMVQYLLNKGAEVNAEPADYLGATALQLAAVGGYIGVAKLLLENGADPNAAPCKHDGRTALEGAAEHGRIDMLKFLVNAGARIDQPQYGRAKELAAGNGHMATNRYLDVLRSEYLHHFENLPE